MRRGFSWRLLRYAAAIAGVAIGGCYRYTPVGDASGDATDVRLQLTEAGGAQLSPVLGAGTTAVAGRVISATDTGFVLAVSETTRNAERIRWAGERVTIPRSAVLAVERRSLDRRRTMGVVAIGVGAAAALGVLIGLIASAAGGDDPGPIIIPP